MLAPWKNSYDWSGQHIKKQRNYFANKGMSSQSYHFSSSQVWMWELDFKQSWALKNWCFWTVELEKTLESPSDFKEIKLVNPKGNKSWILMGSTDADATWAQPRGATLLPRAGSVAKRSYPGPKGRGGSREELPHIRGKEKRLWFAEVAIKRDHCSR